MPRQVASTRNIPRPPAKKDDPPSPFEQAPSDIQSFLSNLSKDKVYLTHIDVHPPSFKKQIFIVPVLLNLSFIALLAWRASIMIPWYFSGLQQLWTMRADTIREVYGSNITTLVRNEIRHFVNIAIDYVLLVVVAPWPYSFFFERPGNPTSWRLRIGFQQRELVVRVSRGWTVTDLLHGDKKGGDSPFWKTRVVPAVQMEKIGKTGYLLMDKDWDLDFAGMTVGQKELGKGFKENEINGKLWCFWRTNDDHEGYWVMWDFRRDMYMSLQNDDGAAAERKEFDEGDVNEGRKMITKFHDKLTQMGKEDLFFKWVELIQYESSRPGGFTPERQVDAGRKVKELFDQFGVDFEQFEKDVGIKDGKLVDTVD